MYCKGKQITLLGFNRFNYRFPGYAYLDRLDRITISYSSRIFDTIMDLEVMSVMSYEYSSKTDPDIVEYVIRFESDCKSFNFGNQHHKISICIKIVWMAKSFTFPAFFLCGCIHIQIPMRNCCPRNIVRNPSTQAKRKRYLYSCWTKSMKDVGALHLLYTDIIAGRLCPSIYIINIE